MYILYHHQLCPLSKQIRVLLDEANIEYSLKREDYWLRQPHFLELSPAGTLPILQITTNDSIVGFYPTIEFLIDSVEDFHLIPNDPLLKSHIRKYIGWFNDKFYREVSKIIVDEKMIRPITRTGEPRSEYIRIAKNNLLHHFTFLEKVLENQSYVACEQISCADIAAATNISIIDYFGEICWDRWPAIKHWYATIKSRSSFRSILKDRVPGLTPPLHYDNPDF